MKAADVMTPDPIVYFPGCFDHRRHGAIRAGRGKYPRGQGRRRSSCLGRPGIRDGRELTYDH